MADTVQFINNLSGEGEAGLAHTHSHEGHTHSHGPNEHGHTHEILDHPGEHHFHGHRWSIFYSCRPISPLLGRFAERDMPDYAGRNFEERGFTIGIGGYARSPSFHHLQIASTRVPPQALTTCTAFHRPVGSGKTALTLALCQKLRAAYNIGAVLILLHGCCSEADDGWVIVPRAGSDCHERHLHEGGPGVSN